MQALIPELTLSIKKVAVFNMVMLTSKAVEEAILAISKAQASITKQTEAVVARITTDLAPKVKT